MPSNDLPARRRAPLWAKLLLSLAAFCIPAALLELGARVFLDPVPGHAFPGLSEGTTPDERLLWRNLPGYAKRDVHGPINSLGFRGPEVELEKPDGVTRILSLGESSAFGDGVQWDEAFAPVLERELRQRGQDVQVWNGGVRAWSSVQSLRFVEQEIERLDADAILFYHEVNDFLPTVLRHVRLRSIGLTDRETMDIMSGRAWLLRFVRGSRFLTWLSLAKARRGADAVLKRIGEMYDQDVMQILLLPYRRLDHIAKPGTRPWMDNPNPLVRVPDPDREETLRELIALTRSRGVDLVLYHPAYRVSLPHRCLLTRIAEQEGVPIIEVEDLLSLDAQQAGLTKDDYFLADDPYHPNVRGHRVIGRGTADVLAELLEDGAATGPDAMAHP